MLEVAADRDDEQMILKALDGALELHLKIKAENELLETTSRGKHG